MENNVEVRKKPPAQMYSRIFTGGVDFNDFFKLQERCEKNGEDWVNVCEELGDRNYTYAQEQLKINRTITARYFFLAAQVMYRLGQYGFVELTDERLRLYHKLADSFTMAAKLFDPPMEEVKIPYKGYNMDGWIIMPKNAPKSCPIVIMIPGATGFKEEFFTQAQHMVERGLAVLLIDGPGQGTTLYFNKGYLEIEIEKAYSTMVDFVVNDGRFGKIGMTGGSTGGYYVPRAAATDKRIAACGINGGSYYPQEITEFAPIYHHKFALLCGVDDEKMKELFPKMTLDGLAEKIDCPLLILHGRDDPIFSVKGVQRIYEEAKTKDKTIKIYPGAWHCCTGYETEAFRTQADWMAEHLK